MPGDNLTDKKVERFRPGAYAILHTDTQVVVVEKMRGPFIGLFDLPGGGIDHGEAPEEALVRELKEEIGLSVLITQFKLVGVFSHVCEYEKEGKTISLHMLGVVYSLFLDDVTFQSILNGEMVGTETDGDAGKKIVLNMDNMDGEILVPICRMGLKQFTN